MTPSAACLHLPAKGQADTIPQKFAAMDTHTPWER